MMRNQTIRHRTGAGRRLTGMLAALVCWAGMIACASASAVTGPAQTPLFLGTRVLPNIMLLLDDSGSMSYAELPAPGAEAAYGSQGVIVPAQFCSGSYYWYGSGCAALDTTDWTQLLPADSKVAPISKAAARAVRRLSCYGFNSLAYNPNETYVPWSGTDANGQPFANQTPTRARVNPMRPTPTVDLTNQVYFPWHDTNGNGRYDGPGATNAGAPASSTDECGDVSSDANGVRVGNLSAAQQRNYASWYTYYRTRSRMAKAVLSGIISKTDARVGLATINNSATAQVSNLTQGSNRAHLLDTLFTMSPGGGTPLRMALDDVYRYFDEGSWHGYYADLLGLNSNWPSPILPQSQGGECQQNFVVLMTDGYWNGNYPGYYGYYSGFAAGNADGGSSPWAGGSYADGYSNTLADVAMRAYATDLAPNLANDVPAEPGVDDNTAQHLDTFAIALGLNGTLASNPTSKTAPFAWPKPQANQPTAVDDLRHAAWDGRGQFLNAHNPQSLSQSLNSAFATIQARNGSASSVAFSSTTLTTGTRLFDALFSTGHWTGDVRAYTLDPTTGKPKSTPDWSAASLLDKMTPASRSILTYNAASAAGTAFLWSDISPAMKSDLETGPSGTTQSVTDGEARLAYLRGDRSNEGKGLGFRSRTSLLGDIVHASPVYVGKPDVAWPDTAPFPTGTQSYSSFVASESSRTPMVYVGANDGMLHAFNASTGQEAFAYVPSNLASTSPDAGLHYLTNPRYAHRYYVDATPSVSDAYFSEFGNAKAWHTVLVGGEGAGGRGLYALDVTNPSTVSQSTASQHVLWQFSDKDDADLGYTFSKPVIARLNNGHWAAIVGNGPGSASGQASLFIIYLDGGQNGQWIEGQNYFKLSTGVGTTSAPDAMFSPTAVDIDGNGTADRIYVGDSDGNVWAFDISSSNPAKWGSAYHSGNSPEPLFSGGSAHPVTAAPTVISNPVIQSSPSTSNPNVMVYVGSGAYYRTSDKTDTTAQRFYGIWDRGRGGLTPSSLVEQTLVASATSGLRLDTSNPVNYAGGAGKVDDGWYLQLAGSERVTHKASIRGGNVFFNTLIPKSTPCSGGGTGYLMSLSDVNGSAPAAPSFDVNGDGVVNASDAAPTTSGGTAVPVGMQYTHGLPGGLSIIGGYRYVGGSATTTLTVNAIAVLNKALKTHRVSWMQLLP